MRISARKLSLSELLYMISETQALEYKDDNDEWKVFNYTDALISWQDAAKKLRNYEFRRCQGRKN